MWNPNGIITFGAPFQRETGLGFSIDTEELYDLSRDPLQHHNVVAEEPATAARLKQRACAFLEERDFHRFAPRPISEEARERLESLGYLQGEDETDDGIPPLASHCRAAP